MHCPKPLQRIYIHIHTDSPSNFRPYLIIMIHWNFMNRVILRPSDIDVITMKGMKTSWRQNY